MTVNPRKGSAHQRKIDGGVQDSLEHHLGNCPCPEGGEKRKGVPLITRKD